MTVINLAPRYDASDFLSLGLMFPTVLGGFCQLADNAYEQLPQDWRNLMDVIGEMFEERGYDTRSTAWSLNLTTQFVETYRAARGI